MTVRDFFLTNFIKNYKKSPVLLFLLLSVVTGVEVRSRTLLSSVSWTLRSRSASRSSSASFCDLGAQTAFLCVFSPSLPALVWSSPLPPSLSFLAPLPPSPSLPHSRLWGWGVDGPSKHPSAPAAPPPPQPHSAPAAPSLRVLRRAYSPR